MLQLIDFLELMKECPKILAVVLPFWGALAANAAWTSPLWHQKLSVLQSIYFICSWPHIRRIWVELVCSLEFAYRDSLSIKMCRICGRMVKCIFDNMPSKVPSTRAFTTISRRTRPSFFPRHICSRPLLSSASENSSCAPIQAPTFLLPLRARLHQTVTQQTETIEPPSTSHISITIPPTIIQSSNFPDASTVKDAISSELSIPRTSADAKPLVLSKSLQELLPLLCAQKPHYITAHVHRFPYLLTEGDSLRLPFHLHGVQAGDVLRFNRASIVGSRDYTLKAGLHSSKPETVGLETGIIKQTAEPPYIDERLFECRMRVMGVETQPMMIKEKTKRRNRKVKTVKSKHKYTVLKVMEIRLKGLEELKKEPGTVILE